MSHLKHVIRKRLVRLLLAGGLVTGAIGAPALLAAGTAQAAACGTATLAGTNCTLTGTLDLLAGPLTLTSPTALAWSGTNNGLNQSLVDTTTAHQSYPVAFTTAATSPTAVTIFDDAALTGLGSITVGVGANPVGWWLNVPASAIAGTYTSTVTLEIISGP